MTATPSNDLRNCRVMVVEDEYMIAEEIVETLSEVGAAVIGPVGSVADALLLAAATGRIDVAILDVNLQSQKIWPVVDALAARGVPMVLTTGYDASAIPAAYAHLPRCEKPVSGRALMLVLARALTADASSG